jgi:hypothetical protein
MGVCVQLHLLVPGPTFPSTNDQRIYFVAELFSAFFRFMAHLISQSASFLETPLALESESALNGIRSAVVGTVESQSETKADVAELNVRLYEEKDGRENTE